jgi:hypothetical protein
MLGAQLLRSSNDRLRLRDNRPRGQSLAEAEAERPDGRPAKLNMKGWLRLESYFWKG